MKKYFEKIDELEREIDAAMTIERREAAARLDNLRRIRQQLAQCRGALVLSIRAQPVNESEAA